MRKDTPAPEAWQRNSVKETEKGVSTMCKAFEEVRNEGRDEGRIEGRINGLQERSIEIALGMIAEGKLALEEIAKYSMLTLGQVKELAEGKN